MMHLFWVILDILGIKKDNYDPLTTEEMEGFVEEALVSPPKDIKEPVYSFVKFLEKHPNSFHLTLKFDSFGDNKYCLWDSFNKLTYRFYYKNPLGCYATWRLSFLEIPDSLTLSEDEKEFLAVAVSLWLDTRRSNVKAYMSKRTKQRQQKVRDKLTAIYKEE